VDGCVSRIHACGKWPLWPSPAHRFCRSGPSHRQVCDFGERNSGRRRARPQVSSMARHSARAWSKFTGAAAESIFSIPPDVNAFFCRNQGNAPRVAPATIRPIVPLRDQINKSSRPPARGRNLQNHQLAEPPLCLLRGRTPAAFIVQFRPIVAEKTSQAGK